VNKNIWQQNFGKDLHRQGEKSRKFEGNLKLLVMNNPDAHTFEK
jgi:hypothetical protein